MKRLNLHKSKKSSQADIETLNGRWLAVPWESYKSTFSPFFTLSLRKMAETLEETSFDYIVLGTGFIESILAGSLARAGKKVLHLDSHQNYGGNWSVFGFRELAQWSMDRKKAGTEEALGEDNTKICYERNYSANFRNVELELFPDINDDSAPVDISADADKKLCDFFCKENDEERKLFAELLKSSRSYNLDSTPKLLGTRDALVETLIRSGVGRYLEFKSVDDIYILDDNSLVKVPSSKEDVFTNKSVSLIEKRKLMKFLTFAMDFEETDPVFEGTENMTYAKFLAEKFKITGKLQQAIVYAIALVDDQAPFRVGLDNTHRFVKAMGRFGKGAYLCPLYGGASEIAQAFCRVCAVYGGVYILSQPLDKYVINEETSRVEGIITKEGQEYKCDKLIAGIDYLNQSWLPKEKAKDTWISRGIVVTDAPLTHVDAETFVADGLSYSVFPPESEGEQPIFAIHQSQESMACPKNEYVTYLWTLSRESGITKKTTEKLLEKTREAVDSEKGLRCIFRSFFDQRTRSSEDYSQELPKNVLACSDPDASFNFESAFEEAIKLFNACEPEAEFMPKAEEDPEDDY